MRRIVTIGILLCCFVLLSCSDNGDSIPDQKQAVDTVYITNTGTKYHKESCGYLRKSKIPISKEDAKSKGYTACSRCRP